jgi:RNA polymerase sigma-70 factor (ECF subfamily)
MESHPPGGATASDEDIVARVRRGDLEAFRFLVQRHQVRLYRYALRMTGDGDTAMDLVQAALIRAHDRLDQCSQPSRFAAWVLAIVANECRHHLRRRRVYLPFQERTVGALAAPDSPARALERSELRALLDQALRRLPVEQREAFLLRHVEGLSYTEMAPVTGASVAALKQRVHRAREALGALLEEMA